MPEFLELLPPAQALDLLIKSFSKIETGIETIDTVLGLGRVTALPVLAPEPLPAFSRSTVDGYAVHAAATYGASESLPAYLSQIGEVPMGKPSGFSINSIEAVLIHTGGMLPEGADAVIMLENTQVTQRDEIEVMRPVAVGENILLPGEDVSLGEEIIPCGTKLRPSEIGGLLALGITRISVRKKPVVGIISSGDEIVPPEVTPLYGQVRDINSYSLGALVNQHGGTPVYYGIAADKFDSVFEKMSTALLECDVIVITAGSSASSRDLTASVVQKLGLPGVLVHGVNIRPGKPTILGVCKHKPVIGLPGNPVSALVIASLFVAPVIEYLLGLTDYAKKFMINATVSANVPSQTGREDWVPVKLSSFGEKYLAEPIFYKSNLIFSLSKADGLAMIPADATGISAGDVVRVRLL